MAYQISSPADVPSALQALADFFSNEMEWDASYDSAGETMWVEPAGVGSRFELAHDEYSYSGSTGSNTGSRIRASASPTASNPVFGDLNTICQPLSPLSRMFVFAGEDPESWANVVFEVKSGYFMHLYLGRLHRYGSYGGGVILDSSSWDFTYTSSPQTDSLRIWDWDSSDENHLLFGGKRARYWADYPGAVAVVSGEADATVYQFRGSSTYRAGGGFGDGYTNLLSLVEASPLDNTVTLHPIIPHADLKGNGFFTPLGAVPGVRLVNITNFDPAQVVEVGQKRWTVFPACSKRVEYGRSEAAEFSPGNHEFGTGSYADYSYYMGGGTEMLGLAIETAD